MTDFLFSLGLFTAKALIVTALILIILTAFFALLAKGKEALKGQLCIKNLNEKYAETTEELLSEVLPKKELKKHLKEQKKKRKEKKEQPNVFVLNFDGDINASAVKNLRKEVTAIVNIAKPTDEVIVKVESGGGTVNGYGLAAAQLQRIRSRDIPLTVAVDRVAASGGYLMSCVANKIIAAPYAIIGSIGVIVQFPNFNRFLKSKNIDFEQHSAGEFKRTVTMFGENTKEGRRKLQEDIEDIHHLFKNTITDYRHDLDIAKVATGEYWLAKKAKELKLVDHLQTSDDYILEKTKIANVFEVSYKTKKSFMNKLSGAAASIWEKVAKQDAKNI